MTPAEIGWLALGALAVAALWVMALRKPRTLSSESVEMATRRAWREPGKHSDRERLRVGGRETA